MSEAKLRQETETLDLKKIMSTGADQKVCLVREYVDTVLGENET